MRLFVERSCVLITMIVLIGGVLVAGEPQTQAAPEKLVGIAYCTAHAEWRNKGHYVLKPTLAKALGYQGPVYNSDDPRVIRQHGEWLADAGVDYALMDWSNNIDYVPGVTKGNKIIDMIEGAVPTIFETWATIPNAPKIAVMIGFPGKREALTDGRLKRKIDQVYDQFIADERVNDQYFRYRGKPLLVVYVGTPTPFPRGVPADLDDRFTMRYLTGFITEQAAIRDGDHSKFGYWSWEDRGPQTYTTVDGRPEFCVVTATSRQQRKPGEPQYIPAIAREDGKTFTARWRRARELSVSHVLVTTWNEFFAWENQGRTDISKDIEPNDVYGDIYLKLLKQEIAAFKAGK